MKYFNLYSNILITKGARRILISDLQRNLSDLYPLEVYDIIEELKYNSIENILKNYDVDSKQIIHEYIDILLEKEYGFITIGSRDENFPPLTYEYQKSVHVSNIFIEFNDVSVLGKIRNSIDNLGVKHLVIFCNKELSIEEIQSIDYEFNNSALEGIEIYSHFHHNINEIFFKVLDQTTLRIYNFIFYKCHQSIFKVKGKFRFTIHFTDQNLKLSTCGKVDLKYFNTNLPKALEAINHNSCLHEKIGIDTEGNIKNCPLMQESFGNIHNISLEKALEMSGFKTYWNLTKDKIEVCRDCEFRYICTDCRAYTERSHTNEDGLDISKPLKCGYDPYTGEWSEWSTNPLKQNAIKYYGL